jgi:hypothetical protein
MSNNDITSAKEYLESQGIKLETTAVITLIDGFLRQPDLCMLMENYFLHKTSVLNSKKDENSVNSASSD